MAPPTAGRSWCRSPPRSSSRRARRGLELVDLGEHRLRDLSRAERVFQVAGAGLPETSRRCLARRRSPGTCRRSSTSFVGREDELSRRSPTLVRGAVVTLTGVGGVGKTRLALQVAAASSTTSPTARGSASSAAADDEEPMASGGRPRRSACTRVGMSLVESIVDFLRAKSCCWCSTTASTSSTAPAARRAASSGRVPTCAARDQPRGPGVDGEQHPCAALARRAEPSDRPDDVGAE